MKSCLPILGGALAGALLTATAVTDIAVQDSSIAATSVKRSEPFARLTARRVPPVDPSRYTDAQRDAKGWSAFDATLLRAADELHAGRFIQDATWKALAGRYDVSQPLEVVFTVGNYTVLAMFHNSVGLPLEDGIKGLPG